jgi:glycosyltransferase involved in cell wall biosynthesis
MLWNIVAVSHAGANIEFSPKESLLRIALIHTRLLYRGGLETRLFSYMEWLRDAGHDVTVIVFRVGKGIQLPHGIRLIHVRIPLVPKVFRAWVFDRKLAKIMADAQFDFSLSLGRTSHQSALLLPGNHLGYLRALGKKRHSLSDKMQILMDRKAYAAPGTILACSEMMKEEVVELYGVNPQKIKVLYPPTDTRRFHLGLKQERAALRERFGMHPDKISLVLVSASHSRKGLPLLLKVFEALQAGPFELLVAGGEAVPDHLPNVRGLGFVKDTEKLFAAADFTVLPASYEPYGQVVTESLLCGTPVLLSEMVGAKSAILPSEGLVVKDLTVEAWVEAIRSLPGRHFEIRPDFAVVNGIDLDAHMRSILGS